MKLYTYYRSTAAYRVRIALALKSLAYESVPVHLVRDGGEHLKPAFRAINPQGRLPVLELADGTRLNQSPAILEYLEETHPEPALLPADAVARARVRAVAAIVACDIHPLNNSGPQAYLRKTMGQDDAAMKAWIGTWITQGFDAIEAMIGEDGFCFGAAPGLADICLVPQVFSAQRFGVALDAWPRIRRVVALAGAHPAFQQAEPARQPDAE